jgi:hypothetical protein
VALHLGSGARAEAVISAVSAAEDVEAVELVGIGGSPFA